ncbi:hypothetical protein BJY52DRAFT_1228130 [Lactarius psammicola]|nr:hypothetical protein BJY52DRAFT_1230917 [Lactarius psammicola]KAI9445659.1 hypothetical protein BJY52DRAFT_1228801 [Lactarius psammicola]KAI9448822.1 hypothetical protein BJY52DRAFT_1228130 [Lactarius psammicola]
MTQDIKTQDIGISTHHTTFSNIKTSESQHTSQHSATSRHWSLDTQLTTFSNIRTRKKLPLTPLQISTTCTTQCPARRERLPAHGGRQRAWGGWECGVSEGVW